ncbi:MAG: helix-turn-helix transcriptional regulator [Lachnospiraceae bacterium]|nr:helix-turn-helix transcriptional regulator [Lachnospiraceae bacterium]
MVFDIEFIEKLMEERGWRKADFSRQSGLSRAYVSKLFNGSRQGGMAVLKGLLKAFPEMDAKDFLVQEPELTPNDGIPAEESIRESISIVQTCGGTE